MDKNGISQFVGDPRGSAGLKKTSSLAAKKPDAETSTVRRSR